MDAFISRRFLAERTRRKKSGLQSLIKLNKSKSPFILTILISLDFKLWSVVLKVHRMLQTKKGFISQ